MTVLAKYQRLETEGVWRPAPEAQRRDVVVSIGEATLTLSTAAGVAQTHWSLPAIIRLNPGQTPALFAPDATETEVLELSDAEMIDALTQVLAAVDHTGKGASRMRLALVGGCVAAFALFVGVWAPGAIGRYAASIVPDAVHTNIGRGLQEQVWRVTGQPCSDPSGNAALNKLAAHLFPSGKTPLAVVPSALSETVVLPDGTILIGRSLVEDYEVPEVLAGYLLAADVRRNDTPPLKSFLGEAGLRTSLRLLTTGTVSVGALRDHAERLVASAPSFVEDRTLIARMATANLPTRPYAYARDISGETTLAFIEADGNNTSGNALLTDGQWIALQTICER